jgi:hypothetical protein
MLGGNPKKNDAIHRIRRRKRRARLAGGHWWCIAYGSDIARAAAAERRDYGEVVLAQLLHRALARFTPSLKHSRRPDVVLFLNGPPLAWVSARQFGEGDADCT